MRRVLSLAGALPLCTLLVLAGIAAGPAAASRTDVPKVPPLDRIEGPYDPVRFDHPAHVENAGGCGDCHHQHGMEEGRACRECHSVDGESFRKAVRPARYRPCAACHPVDPGRGDLSAISLKAAYHRACIRCHRDVGSVGEDPKGCTEMCHERKAGRRANP